MAKASDVYVFQDTEDLLVCCKACKSEIGRIRSSIRLIAEGRQHEIDQRVSKIKSQHLQSCPGAGKTG